MLHFCKYLGVVCCFCSNAQSISLKEKDSINAEIMLFVDSYDEKLLTIFNKLYPISVNDSTLNLPSDSIPYYNDSIIKSRLNFLDEKSPFEFILNPSTSYSINYYINKRRKSTAIMIKLSQLYFPLFDEYLSKYQLPYELRYLPIVESALNPKAKSRAGAIGLWQFMPTTAKMMGLKINSFIDERCDPFLSTDAACKYLSHLFSIYKNWNLALAAYNAGPGNVNKAIRRAGGKTSYWEIIPFLPKETQKYVPTFIAVNYIMSYANEHNIQSAKPEFKYFDVDTIHVCNRIEFDILEEWLCYDKEHLLLLNPMFTNEIIPKPENHYSLVLPTFLLGDYIMLEDSIAKYSSLNYQYSVISNKPSDTNIKKEVNSIYYTIKKGDTIWDIAQQYQGISVSDIKNLNRSLNVHQLKAGSVIVIFKN